MPYIPWDRACHWDAQFLEVFYTCMGRGHGIMILQWRQESLYHDISVYQDCFSLTWITPLWNYIIFHKIYRLFRFVFFCYVYVSISNGVHPDSKVLGANMGPTWVLSAPDGPHVGPRYLAIWALLLGYIVDTHYCDVIMSTLASQITGASIVYSTVYSGADQRKHQSSASLAFVRGIHRKPVNSLNKGQVTRKMFPFDDVIMVSSILVCTQPQAGFSIYA